MRDSCFDHYSGHTPDSTRRTVLHQDPSTRAANRFAAFQTIGTHAREHDTDHGIAVNLRRGTEERIH